MADKTKNPGPVEFGKTVSIAGALTHSDTTDATSKTAGAAKFAGGIAVDKKIHAGEKVTIDTGGLQVTAGVTYCRGGAILPQGAQATTDDGTTALSAANIATGIIQCTPTGDHSKATDTAANIISACGLTADNDCFDFSVINLATDGSSHITITFGATGITGVGCAVISAQDLAEDAFTSGVGRFRVRRTGAATATIYRIA
jgi:hypothetical protein